MILSAINKNVADKKWKCIIENCEEYAINSHIYQQNGILNSVAENGHLMEVKPIDIFKWQDKKFHEITNFKRIGIKQAFSYPTLCNHHDTSIFLDIERHPIDLNNYKNQLLFFYRTLLSAKRKTQIVLDKETRITKSQILASNPYCGSVINMSLKNIGVINDLLVRHDAEISRISNDILNDYKSFTIIKFEYDLVKAYGMSMNFSPESQNFVYTNVFPYDGKTIVIVGSFTEKTDLWTKQYFDTWRNLTSRDFEIKLTTFLAKNSENWGLSPKIVENIKAEDLNKFLKLKSDIVTKGMLSDIELILDLGYQMDYNFFAENNYGS